MNKKEEVRQKSNPHKNSLNKIKDSKKTRSDDSLKLQELSLKIASDFNLTSDFEIKIQKAIKLIGETAGAGRVSIWENNQEKNQFRITYEWSKNAEDSFYSDFLDFPVTLFENNDFIISENTAELPDDIAAFFKSRNAKSAMFFQMQTGEDTPGYLCLENLNNRRKLSEAEILFLRQTTVVFSNALHRKKLQNKLLHHKKEKSAIIDSIADVVLQLDISGKITMFKSPPQYSLFSKLNHTETISIQSVFNDKLAQTFNTAIDKCLKKGRFDFNFKHLELNDTEHYEVHLVKLDSTSVLAIIRSITELKKSEKQLRIAKNKAEKASKIKSQFLANVSHEIRTPLNAILGFSQWLFENTDNELHKDYLDTIRASGRNLLNLINDILDLSKIESEKMHIDMQPMNYQEVINDIKLVFRQKTEDKGLSFKITTDPSVPPFIYMDELRFYQVIFNLVSNAVKFTAKGFIHVSATAVPTKNKDKINLAISVEDTGTGIRENQQKEIFESFTKQTGQNNRAIEGTGLGLAIVHGLLKKLNGSVTFKSNVGKGSLFTVTFYDVKVDRTEHTKDETLAEVAEMKIDPCTIMIVDDVSYNILVLKQLIGSKQVSFIEANDGTQALAKLKMKKPDLIFMDIRMPGLSGFDVTEIIKQDDDLKDIPVIAFTASTLKEKNDRIDKLFDSYLQKPVFKKELHATLRKLLNYSYVDEATDIKAQKAEPVKISSDCLEKLPDLIQELENSVKKNWEEIKNDLVIYEIEDFNNRLEQFALKYNCSSILNYCRELNKGIQTFDIELIEKKLKEYPLLLENLQMLNFQT